MNPVPHIPALRLGRSYESLDQLPVVDHRTGQPLATLSQINAGIVRKDLQRVSEARAALESIPAAKLIEICASAGRHFKDGTLPLGNQGYSQSPQQYIETLSATSGLPWVLVERNMNKIASALANMGTILNGLTRGLDLSILDRRFGEQNGARVCFYPAAQALGLVMPSNSPAVNSLWLPAIALKVPVIVKPGREEPWTPYRLIQAFLAAGCPAEAFGFYPTDHEGAGEILKGCDRALVFGDQATTTQYSGNPRIQVHGPGFSKFLLGEDEVERWPEFIDLLVSSIADNGGRSCINASAVLTPRYADEIADALAERLGPVQPLPASDPKATLSAFANPKMAEGIDHVIDDGLAVAGARDITAGHRSGPRKVFFEGGLYLRPTIVRCDSMSHPLANREFLFPYASVVEVPQAEMLRQIGPSLVVTAITRDPAWERQLLRCPLIDRLNLGPVSTMNIAWDQPHEGNMFEFLYRRRAFQRAP
ncbi:MAG: aldehyde dehydrogenase family protein [Verrucomicrobiia bacterium]